MLIKEISKVVEVIGLDNVDPMGIIEVSEIHCQSLSNEELCVLVQQLTERQKEDEDVLGTKEMQTRDLTDILSIIDMAAEKSCDINPDGECSSTVRRA